MAFVQNVGLRVRLQWWKWSFGQKVEELILNFWINSTEILEAYELMNKQYRRLSNNDSLPYWFFCYELNQTIKESTKRIRTYLCCP